MHWNAEAKRLYSPWARKEVFEGTIPFDESLELSAAAPLIWRFLSCIYHPNIPNLCSLHMAICSAVSRPFLCPFVNCVYSQTKKDSAGPSEEAFMSHSYCDVGNQSEVLNMRKETNKAR